MASGRGLLYLHICYFKYLNKYIFKYSFSDIQIKKINSDFSENFYDSIQKAFSFLFVFCLQFSLMFHVLFSQILYREEERLRRNNKILIFWNARLEESTLVLIDSWIDLREKMGKAVYFGQKSSSYQMKRTIK